MAQSLPDDDFDDIDDTELEDSEDDDADDGGPAADDDESDDGDNSLRDAATLAATMPVGMPGRKQQPQAAVPNHPGGKPEATPHQPGPGGKPPAGQQAGHTPGGQHPAPGHPAANHPAAGPHPPEPLTVKGKSDGKRKGSTGSKALEAAEKEFDTARKAHDALEKPHSTATKKLVDSAKTLATGLKPFDDALKKSTTEHKTAKKDDDDHGKLQDELDKALTGDGLVLIMKGVNALQPWINKIMEYLGKLKDALFKAFEKALKPVADFFGRVWSKVVVPMFQKTVQAVSGAFNAVGDILGRVFDSLKKACAAVVRAVGEVLKDLDFTVPSWVPVAGGASLGLGKIGDTLIEWSTKMRDGGLVRGAGGPREDKVPVMMSNGEFVVNAASAAKHLNLLRALNNEASGIRSTLESGYAATAKSLPGTAGMEARSLTRSDRPQLVVVTPLGLGGDHVDRSLKFNISAPEIHHAHLEDSATNARKSLTYSSGRR
jgi:hypothetical protein